MSVSRFRRLSRRALLPAALLALPSAGVGAAEPAPTAARPGAVDTAVFAGGCFWGVEGVYEHVDGVLGVVSGYATGAARDAATPVSYDRVSSGRTNFAEAVRVVYDPAKVSYDQLLTLFFTVVHDPTQLDRQGPDVGPQYRSAVFPRTDAQRRAVAAHVARLREAKAFAKPIVTRVEPLAAFREAEAYHQDYMAAHPDAAYIVAHDAPKLERLRREYPKLYRERTAAALDAGRR